MLMVSIIQRLPMVMVLGRSQIILLPVLIDGPHTVAVTATDPAGNTATDTATLLLIQSLQTRSVRSRFLKT